LDALAHRRATGFFLGDGGGGGGHGDGSDLALSCSEAALVGEVLSLLLQLSDLLGTEASTLLSSLLLLLHPLGLAECLLHSLTLALIVHISELLAARLDVALHLTLPVVFLIPTLSTLLEILLTLIEPFSLDLSATLLP